LITNLIGFVYPAFVSLKALESGKADAQWVFYWITFGMFSLFDYFSDVLLKWFPFFYIFKVGFLVYMFLPQTQVD
jgi:receptor expression-enhancing protein 5/6